MKELSLTKMETLEGGASPWTQEEFSDWGCFAIGMAFGLACWVCGGVAGAVCMAME